MTRGDTIQVDGHPMRVYLDIPAGDGGVPGVVVIMHGPGLDRFVEDRVEDMTRHGKPHEFHHYEGAGHAFLNFMNADRHRPKQGADAWRKMLAFLDRHLKAARAA